MAATALVVLGCDSRTPTTPPTTEASIVSARQEGDLRADPRFDVAVAVTGDLAPGQPVHFRVEGVALLPTAAAELSLVFPEVEAANQSGWGSDFRATTEMRLPPVETVRESLPRNARASLNATVVFPAAGYYSYVATMIQKSSEPVVDNGRFIQNVAYVEGWLLVQDGAGRRTASFDTTLIPTGMRKTPGPFRSVRGVRVPSEPPPSAEASPTSGVITYQVVYVNSDFGRNDPVPYATYTLLKCSDPQAENCETWVEFAYGQTNAAGYLQFACEDAPGEYFGTAESSNGLVHISPGSGAIVQGRGESDCGAVFSAYMGAGSAHSFVAMQKTRAYSEAFFGASRPQVRVVHDPSADNSAYYSGSDEIVIDSNNPDGHIWGGWGAFVHAHEYGHAFHEKGLGGNVAKHQCPSPHEVGGAYNLQCAYSEGFAHVHAAVTRPDVPAWYYPYPSALEANQWYGGGDGSIVEGAVAGFLYDIVDSGIESHDVVNAPGTYVRDIVQTCEWQYPSYLSWWRANGVDHLVYCMENQVDPAVAGSYFLTRNRNQVPLAQREAASESSSWGWSLTNVRNVWRRNLYGL